MPKPILFRWTQWVWPLLIGVGSAAGVLWLGATYEVIDPITKQTTTSLELLRGVYLDFPLNLGRFSCYSLRAHSRFWIHRSAENFVLPVVFLAAIHREHPLVGTVFSPHTECRLVVLRQPWSFCTADGLKWGKSLATVFATAMLDEAFYLLAVPLVFGLSIWAGHPIFPAINEDLSLLDWGLSSLFGVAYAFIASLTALMWFGLVLRPEKTHRFIQRLGASRPLERWGGRIKQWSTDLLEASQDIRHAPRSFWIQGFAATCASWTARFLTLNAVLLIFYPHIAHGAVLARQLVLWIVLSISPTPGSSGVAELGLPSFLGDLTGVGYMAGVVLIWRIMTYFIYLLAGVFVLPQWWVRTQKGNKRP